uniref:Uncharacterized protein n=1 Tax=Anguilla anguilla TaxID=7936 RepID=A0A0E9RND2_ANGAN
MLIERGYPSSSTRNVRQFPPQN